MGRVELAVDREGPRRQVELFGVCYGGIDQGEEVAAWFSRLLGVPSRLVRVPPEHARVTGGLVAGTSGYADSCPVHLLSSASVELLGQRLVERGAEPVPVQRFRPNLVLAGDARPHWEDEVGRLVCGETEMAFAKPAVRCVVTTVDQQVGVKAGPEPLRTLAGYRRSAEGGVVFGVKLAVVCSGVLTVGEVVEVEER